MEKVRPTKTRIDKWLWAARFYKTRQIAIAAVNAGHVQVNGQRVKPARTVEMGDAIRIKTHILEINIVIDAILDKRGSASIAQTLYTESAESIARRQALQAERKLHAAALTPRKRPDKRARGKIIRFQRQT